MRIIGVGTGCVSITVCAKVWRVAELKIREFLGMKGEVSGIQFGEIENRRILSMTLPGEEAGTCERRISGSLRVE